MAIRSIGSSFWGGRAGDCCCVCVRLCFVECVLEIGRAEGACDDRVGVGHVLEDDKADRPAVVAATESGMRDVCRGGATEVFGADALSSVSEAKAASIFSPVPHAAQNFIYRETIVSKKVSCVLGSDSRVSPFDGRP